MTFDADVIVVGAGPTGLVLANLLGRQGIATVLVERNATTVQEPRAVSIDDESLRTLQAIGLADAIGPMLARGYGSRYRGPSGAVFASVEPTSTEFGFDKRNAFQQPELEDLLRQGLSRYETVRPLFGHELRGFDQDEAGVSATAVDSEGDEVSLRASYLVGCDGARSLVRKTLGIQLVGSSFEQRWLIVDLCETANRFRHTEVFCDVARPAISLPGPGGTRRYEFLLQPSESDELASGETFVRRLLASVGPDRDAPLRRVRPYLFHARVAERWREGRVFIAGDAAHLSPPFAGQGMNSGVRDAHNLAWKLALSVRGGAAPEVLDSYGTERIPHARAMIELALSMGAVMMPSSRIKALLTRTAFRALGVYPPARNYVSQMKYKPVPRFRAGLLRPDGRRASMIGRLLPQPIVERGDGSRLLLDDALPEGPLLLIHDDDPARGIEPAQVRRFSQAGIAVIGVTPEWMNPASADFPIFRDASRGFLNSAVAAYRGHALLVRPDRYVAAAAKCGELEDLLPVARLIAHGRKDDVPYNQ